jgi:NAD(P)-dependent dehydrogenase (short-subunit alcohol dehydrogenase family)
MPDSGLVVLVGGTGGIGRQIARHYAERGRDVVISGRDAELAKASAEEIGARGIGLDLTRVDEIAGRLAELGPVDHLVICAIARDHNTVRDYDPGKAASLVTLKLVGYTEAVHALAPKLGDESSIVLFGGLAKDRPYPGSATVTAVNGAVTAMVRSFAIELAPVRVNAVHPGIVGDSPFWSEKTEALERVLARTPTGRLVAMQDIVGAVVFLLENPSMNGVNLRVDGGWMLL